MRTDEQILERINEIEKHNFFERGDLLARLPFSKAAPFYENGASGWEIPAPRDHEAIIKEMREYMSFALDKADNHRGISASRSIAHYSAWLWLLGDEELLSYAENDSNYANYGVPILRKICEKYDFPFPLENEGLVNMSLGKPCHSGCDDGCGK